MSFHSKSPLVSLEVNLCDSQSMMHDARLNRRETHETTYLWHTRRADTFTESLVICCRSGTRWCKYKLKAICCANEKVASDACHANQWNGRSASASLLRRVLSLSFPSLPSLLSPSFTLCTQLYTFIQWQAAYQRTALPCECLCLRDWLSSLHLSPSLPLSLGQR